MAAAPPPPPPKPTSANPALDAIIKEIEESKERERKEKASASATPQAPTGEPSSERRKEGKDKWRSYSEEKQKKLYENTVRPTKLVYSPTTNQDAAVSSHQVCRRQIQA